MDANIKSVSAIGPNMAIGVAAAGIQSYDKYHDWRRAGLQVGASAFLSFASFGISNKAEAALSAGRAGIAAIGMNTLPFDYGIGQLVSNGIDGIQW